MIKPIAAVITALEESGTKADRLIKTGFPTIDKAYFGLAPKEVTVIGAYTGSGKTFFCLQLALNIARQKKRVPYFSLEMPSEALVARVWANISKVHPTRIEFGMLTPEEFKKKQDSRTELLSLSDYLAFDDNSYTVEAIKQTISDLTKQDKKPDVVFVDFLQNLQSPKEEYAKLSESIVELQRFAKETDTAWIFVSQVSNEEAKAGTESKIIGYKGSGGVAAAADFGLWLERSVDYSATESDSQQVDLTFRKVRRGPNKKISLKYSFPSGEVTEVGARPAGSPYQKPVEREAQIDLT